MVRWRGNEIIGMGSSSIVYSAVRVDTQEMIAVKKFRVVSDISGVDHKKLRTIKNEIDIYKQLKHPHIVNYYGCELIN